MRGYFGFGGGSGFGTPVVSYAPRPMLRFGCVGVVVIRGLRSTVSEIPLRWGQQTNMAIGGTHICCGNNGLTGHVTSKSEIE